MEIKEITDKNTWEGFWASREEKTFLQSWNWGEFWQKMGNKIWRLEGMLAVKVAARRGTFLLVQHNVGISEALLDELKKIAKEEKCDFIRMAPLIQKSEENNGAFKNLEFREAGMHANAYEATWKLDITLPEEELLKNMRKTTRYLIKKARENSDISIEKSADSKNIEIY